MAQSIYDDSNQYRSVSDQVSECSSWTINQKFALFGQIRFWLKCGLSIGWVINKGGWATSPPLITPALSDNLVAAQFNSKSSCQAHSITSVLLLVQI